MQLFHKPVTSRLRKLVIAQIILSVLAFIFEMFSLGAESWFILVLTIIFNWIYHAVIIVKDNRSASSARLSGTISLYSSKAGLGCGWTLAALWGIGYIVDLGFRSFTEAHSRHTFIWLTIVDLVVCAFGTGVTFALMYVAQTERNSAAAVYDRQSNDGTDASTLRGNESLNSKV